MGNKRIQILPANYYHIYNHGVSTNNIFANEDNYFFFLNQYHKYISPIADTYAYCLLPNHFHFLIKINTQNELENLWKKIEPEEDISKKISHTFGSLFNSYTKAYNKQQNRKGKLFMDNFERKIIDNNMYFKMLIHYIHFNPVHHGFVKDLRDWKYSSYESFFSKKSTNLKRDEVIKMFENKNDFFEYHKQEINSKLALELDFI